MESSEPTSLFYALIRQRGWQEYDVFRRNYVRAARELADIEGQVGLTRATIEKRQFQRWVSGHFSGMPRRDARRILEHLFRPASVRALFSPMPPSGEVPGYAVAQSNICIEGGSDIEDVVMAAASESAEFAATTEATNCGPHTLEQLESDIRRIVTSYPNRPIMPLFHEVKELRNRTFELLEGRQPPMLTRDLYVAAGVLCGVLANASFDLGRYSAAETQARTAFVCAELAGHNGLRVWVRGLQALIAYWDGRPNDAARLADIGEQFLPEHGTAHIRLMSIKARAHGQLSRPAEALAAIREADRLREGLTNSDDLPGGMMVFPREKQLFYASSTQLWLGGRHLSEAERIAEEAVDMYEAVPPQKRRLGEMSLARIDLAMARMGRGELEGAAHQVHAVIEADAQRGTESVRKRLVQFTRSLALHPAGKSPLALGLRGALAAHQEKRTAQLPPGDTQ